MENLNLILLICLGIPMSMMLLIFRGRSRILCGFLIAGMFMCVFSGEINGLFSVNIDTQTIAVNIAPLVEEITKSIPIIFISFLLKPTMQDLAEFSLSVGVGFATLENACILINNGSVSLGYALLRALGAGMMHGICTLIIGITMKVVLVEKMALFSGILSALSVAVIYHSIYNMLVSSRYMLVGTLLPVVTLFVIFGLSLYQKKKSEIKYGKAG